ncbi:ANTAR domain-containing response regulator [Derxia lacustris]|uniref:ANTAR domain-containing response regulator n=1 Tax=Derxia lacustris TaxID=764842 RepID=UPI000A16F004|nr:ANTAR domain-containing protein [Derxia lacustris]
MTDRQRIIVINDSGDAYDGADPQLFEQLQALGFEVRAVSGYDIKLPEIIEAFAPEVVIIRSDSDARDVLEHVVVATRDRPRPIAMFSASESTQHVAALLRQGVSAYVAEGMNPAKLKPVLEVAVARFRLDQQLLAELADTRSQLDDRKHIDKAKALLIKRGLSEDEAHRRLRRMAMEKNLKLGEVARRVVEMADLLV